MGVKLLFFAQCAQRMKCKEMDIELNGSVTLEDIMEKRSELEPIREYRKSLKVSINHEFVGFDEIINDGDEIAFLPPFSGG